QEYLLPRVDGKADSPTAGGHNTIVLQAEPPKDHIIWSLCSFFYFNPMCLGLAALIFSIKSRDRKVVGDLEGARHYGATARYLNIAQSAKPLIPFLPLLLLLQHCSFCHLIKMIKKKLEISNLAIKMD
uniref:Uncharacterized protein n=1 Tax=Oryzias latipes TaxID=8090 RepID=A0A3B3HHF8_ORYLA